MDRRPRLQHRILVLHHQILKIFIQLKMAQKTVDIEVSAIYSFTYDPESPEFKKTLKETSNAFVNVHNEESLLVHVAKGLRYTQSVEAPISFVGFLKKEGGKTPNVYFSGITVENDDPDFNYEIL